MTIPLVVNCPTCQQSVIWGPENPYRPFCCQRCQLIDLGAWASEQRVIADQAERNPSKALSLCDPVD